LLKLLGMFGSMVASQQAGWRKTPTNSLLCAACNDPRGRNLGLRRLGVDHSGLDWRSIGWLAHSMLST
jgi:hypothetical protein